MPASARLPERDLPAQLRARLFAHLRHPRRPPRSPAAGRPAIQRRPPLPGNADSRRSAGVRRGTMPASYPGRRSSSGHMYRAQTSSPVTRHVSAASAFALGDLRRTVSGRSRPRRTDRTFRCRARSDRPAVLPWCRSCSGAGVLAEGWRPRPLAWPPGMRKPVPGPGVSHPRRTAGGMPCGQATQRSGEWGASGDHL